MLSESAREAIDEQDNTTTHLGEISQTAREPHPQNE